jgi:DNA modification methylase
LSIKKVNILVIFRDILLTYPVQSENIGSQEVLRVELNDKVQFVYEIAFAKRELDGLGVKFKMELEDRIQFELKKPYDENVLLRRLAHFDRVGERLTDNYSKILSRNIRRSDNQYLTHWYYPYKGKYHPRLIRSIFNIINLQSGQTVLDPFVGSGTTSLEAYLFGLNSIGFDISPICIIISKVKVTAGRVAEQLHLYRSDAVRSMKKDFDRISTRSLGIQKLVDNSDKTNYQQFLDSINDERIKNFYLLAQLIFASDRGRRKRDFSSFERNLDMMIISATALAAAENDLRQNLTLGKADLAVGNALRLPLADESVDAIITSPPYSIALNYMENDKYALQELGINIEQLCNDCIGVKGKGNLKLRLYESDMQKCYTEMYRVLKQGCKCVVVIGEAKYDGEQTKTVGNSISFCKNLGFKLEDEIPKKIFGLYNTINDEKVLFFKK